MSEEEKGAESVEAQVESKADRRRGRGRPIGARTEVKPVVTVESSRCPSCFSTERAAYSNTCPRELSGQTPDGKPFSRVIWRHTRCLKCGSSRIDKFYEFDGQERLWQSPQG